MKTCANIKTKTPFASSSELGSIEMLDVWIEGYSLRKLFESEDPHQIWWGVRNDQIAFREHFSIEFPENSILNLQLIEMAVSEIDKRDRPSLLATIEKYEV